MDTFSKNNYTEAIEQNLPFIRKICAGFTEDQEELKDLVQEVCIQVWKSLDSFKGQSKLTTWIYRITVNMCLYQIGKRKKKRLVLTDQPQLIRSVESKQGIPDELNMREVLYAGIKLLKPIDRAIIMLYLDKKSYQEIAEIIGITPTNVGAKINRSKKTLKRLIHERLKPNLG